MYLSLQLLILCLDLIGLFQNFGLDLLVAAAFKSKLVDFLSFFVDFRKEFSFLDLVKLVDAIKIGIELCLEHEYFVKEVGVLYLDNVLHFFSPLLFEFFLGEALILELSFKLLVFFGDGIEALGQLLIFGGELVDSGFICCLYALHLLYTRHLSLSDSF